ncbi:hypothetical protein O181_086861 [Austropuccinia psidii MF-1]|uniref:Tf2-1-like SH3-like domain-containing protein n=1 Tax=Austropuccinia psidii MF-1 TaxID=1389203 RepID=A0A9Q3P4H6_9BASI|nr:hypothetical protein [Austropuccinia psidii MF-1]
MEPDFKEGDQVLVSTLNFNNLKGPNKMRDSFVGPFTIINLIGKSAMEVRLTAEFSRKQPVFPVSPVKPYFQTEDNKFPSRKKTPPHKRYCSWKTPLGLRRKSSRPGRLSLMVKTRDCTWSDLRTRQHIKTTGWLKMPYQMGTFI